jgi:hypothetical protein
LFDFPEQLFSISYTFTLQFNQIPTFGIMGFKKREYNFYKKLCKESVKSTVNHEIYGCDPIMPPEILLEMLPRYVAEENWEACAAIKDTIREWFEERCYPIPSNAQLNIPEGELRPHLIRRSR